MEQTVLRNARIVAGGETLTGSLVLEEGRITRLDQGGGTCGRDMAGDFLIPGLVDLHTDSLERQFTPRHGVYWPSPLAAAMANDALLCGCGMTTVLDAVCAEAFPAEKARRRLFADCIAAVSQGVRLGLFRCRHLLHLRCETADPETPRILGDHLGNPLVRLASLMDHTPGQRQYRDVGMFRKYYSDVGWDDEEFAQVVQRLKQEQRRWAQIQRRDIVRRCCEQGIPLASHDDAEESHVRQAQEEGVGICEFPTTLAAARTAFEAGMGVVLGAPNLVLGGSHSGNVSALEVFRAGHLTALSSDYVPFSLLLAPFLLAEQEGRPLHECLALVSANPARMLGLDDRGELLPGRRADLVRVRLVDGRPVPLAVWVDGRTVLGR